MSRSNDSVLWRPGSDSAAEVAAALRSPDNFRGERLMARRDIRIDGVLDMEAHDWTTYVVAALRFSGQHREHWWPEEEELLESLLDFGGVVWAHFGGGYDYKWVLDYAAALGVPVRLSTAGSRIVSMRIRRTEFCDFFALAPMSLEKLTKGLGVAKEKLALPCECGRACGGYCAINRAMSAEYKARVSKYLEADCGSLEEAGQKLRDFAKAHDLDLGRTIGSSAWRHVRRSHGVPRAEMDGDDYAFCRQGYHGGRTERYDVRMLDRVLGHDVNSMYPWALATFPQPVGERRRETGRSARIRYAAGAPGYYRAVVDVPESFLPPLPRKHRRGTALAFPFGAFEGVWARDELRHAEGLGTAVNVVEALTWEGEAHVFAPWVRRLWHLRLHCACPRREECSLDAPDHVRDVKTTPIGNWLKLDLNSMIGKLGTNPEQERWSVNPPRRTLRLCDCPLGEPCTKGHHRQVSDRCFVSVERRLADCGHVEWAGVALAHARVAIHDYELLADEGTDMAYLDTDGGYRLRDVEALRPEWAAANVGDELGQFQRQPSKGEARDFQAHAPKVYSYRTVMPDGTEELVARAKGVKLPTAEVDGKKVHVERPVVGRQYEKTGVIGFRAGARRGKFFTKTTITRVLREQCGGRLPTPSALGRRDWPDGKTYPPHVSDLEP